MPPVGRGPWVPDPHGLLRARCGDDRERRALLPHAAGTAVGGHEDEARGVVLRGSLPAPGAAGAPGGRVTVRAVVTFYPMRPDRASSS